MKNLIPILKTSLSLFLVLICFSCGKKKPPEAVAEKNDLLKVVPVNYPLYYFADRIGGQWIELAYPIPSGIDPAYWNPDEKTLELYQSADLIIKNGADYAKWTENVSLPSSKVVITCSVITNELIPLDQMKTHSHGNEGEHQHAELAFTTWLDFNLAGQQAEVIKIELSRRIPERSEALTANYEALKRDLESLDAELSEEAQRLKGLTLIGSHPVYQYLAAEYDLNILSVHFEPDQMPSAEQWASFDKIINGLQHRIMLWEGTPTDDIRSELSKRNVQIVVFEPCGNKPPTGEFLTVMNGNLLNLKSVEL